MPIPLIIAGVAAVTVGAGGHICAKEKNEKAAALSEEAKKLYEDEKKLLETAKRKTEKSLSRLGYKKKDILDNSMKRFLTAYEKVKKVEFKRTAGLDEIAGFAFDEQAALEMQEMSSIYSNTLKSGAVGAATGAVISLAASGTLSLAASALAAGGVGLAGSVVGSTVSLGLATTSLSAVIAPIAAPVVLFTGISASVKADENLEKAQVMYSQAEEAVEKMKVSETMCNAIAERSNMFCDLLADLDSMFDVCVHLMGEVVARRDNSIKRVMVFRDFNEEEEKLIAVTRALAGAIKSVIDTPILSANGEITEESEKEYNETYSKLPQLSTTVVSVKDVDYKSLREEEDKKFLEIKEVEISSLCDNLNGYSCAALWDILQGIQAYSYAQFNQYSDKVASAMRLQERAEHNKILDSIETAGLDELEYIYAGVQQRYYSEELKKNVAEAIEARRYVCQKEILDAVTVNLGSYSREELTRIVLEINANDFMEVLAAEYLNKIKRQYDLIEERELREMCVGIESRGIDELKELMVRIGENNYQITFAKKYFDMIDSRIEYIHMRNLETICKDINVADRDAIKIIYHNINQEDCAANLKKKFFDMVSKREEVLDYNELCEMTSNVDTLSIEQLDSLLKDLTEGEYNPKFIKRFILQVRTALENAQCRYVAEVVSGYESMDRKQVYDAQYLIKQSAYPERMVDNALCALDERMYVLDMFELIDMENDFDQLDLYKLTHIRSIIKQKNVSERSRNTYLTKIREREMTIAYQKVSKYAAYVYHYFLSNNLKTDKFLIPVFSDGYNQYYQIFLNKRNNEEDLNDIPAFIYPDCAMLAFTKSNLYVSVGAEYRSIAFEDIRDFTVEKKLLSYMLVMTYANGNRLTLKDGITKGNAQPLAYVLNGIIRNAQNETLYSSYNEYQNHIVNFDKNRFSAGGLPTGATYDVICDIFLNQYNEVENDYGKSRSIKTKRTEEWNVTEAKINNGFGINAAESYVMYYDKTFLNSAKEGFALGKEAMYIKDGGKPVVSIKYTDIFSVESNQNGLIIDTITNNTFYVGIKLPKQEGIKDFAVAVEEYVKGIQLLNVIAIELNDGAHEEKNLFCFHCGNRLDDNAIFCAKCGTKVK